MANSASLAPASSREFTGVRIDSRPTAVASSIYALLGAGWLVLKTEGEIQERARRYGRVCLVGVLIGILLISIWTPQMSETVSRRWFSWPNILILSPVPIATETGTVKRSMPISPSLLTQGSSLVRFGGTKLIASRSREAAKNRRFCPLYCGLTLSKPPPSNCRV